VSLYADFEKKLDSFTLKVSFSVTDGVLALLGASGSGKSMTMQCISGVRKPDRGRIAINDRTVFDRERRINLPPQERRTGYLFQNYALFPNMTVYENILVSVRKSGIRNSRERIQRARDIIDRMQLSGVMNSRATEISGGQMQRTALARILVNDADIMMLDEPFSALDEHLRFSMERELRAVIREFGRTVLYVSHNRDEVWRIADHVAIMNNGIIETMGTVREVFENPVTVNGARLTGIKNIAPAVADGAGFLMVPGWGLRVPLPSRTGTGVRLPDPSRISAAGLRMNDIRTVPEAGVPGSWHTFVTDAVTPNLFGFTLELHNAGVPDPLPLFWEVSRDVWRPGTERTVSLFVPDRAVAGLVA